MLRELDSSHVAGRVNFQCGPAAEQRRTLRPHRASRWEPIGAEKQRLNGKLMRMPSSRLRIGPSCIATCGGHQALLAAFRSTTRSHIRRTRQSLFSQRRPSSIRLPLQTSRPLWLQYRQIACWTNRGKVCGNVGLNCRASMCSATAAIMWAQPPVPSRAGGISTPEPLTNSGPAAVGQILTALAKSVSPHS